jgi:hypothetical protein
VPPSHSYGPPVTAVSPTLHDIELLFTTGSGSSSLAFGHSHGMAILDCCTDFHTLAFECVPVFTHGGIYTGVSYHQ